MTDYMDRMHDCPKCGEERGAGTMHVCKEKTELTFKKLTEANIERCKKGFKHTLESWSLLEWGGATAGEIGEACNVAKKIIRYRDGVKGNKPTDNIENLKVKLGGEIADGIVYAFLWASAADIDLEAAVRKAFNDKSDEIGSDVKI